LLRRLLVLVWLAVIITALYLFFFHREAIQDRLESATSASMLVGGSAYLLRGCIRGFTLIPSTSLVLLAVAFFPPAPLFALTLAGIVVSSACIYYFAEALGIDNVLQRRHAAQFNRVRTLLVRYELPAIIGWSFFPLAPTDLVVYLCGIMRVSLAKCLVGVAIGEGTICAVYIFGADRLLRLLELKG
jgi:uncharacterized membrane protein YdjX (TVP38/TMEM64 family)